MVNGNDFIIVNSIENELKINKNKIINISDRNTGIGFDQLIKKLDLPTKPNQNFFIRFFNADGSEAWNVPQWHKVCCKIYMEQ